MGATTVKDNPVLWLYRVLFSFVVVAGMLGPASLSAAAVIVSPHFDDECLGCGGTILRKRRARAAVQLAFMTDGSQSHRGLVAEEELRQIRAAEGRAAGRALGLDDEAVHLLGFPETRLKDHADAAADALYALLQRQQPEQVFIPYVREPRLWSDDHVVTTQAARAALARYNQPVTVYEYPIWFWYRRPWVKVPPAKSAHGPALPQLGLRATYYALRELRWAVPVQEVLAQKQQALCEHRSQMTRLRPDPRWSTLGEVAGGQFLPLFFQPYECFYRWQWPANGHGNGHI